jgi:hypothetical protein
LDGVLKLEVPIKTKDTDLEVVLIVQPTKSAQTDEHGWPPGFFEQTFGSFRDAPLVREPQGEYG